MKALTILQPYAYLIIAGIKPIENRTWSTNHRGPLLIQAGVNPHPHPIAEIEARYGVKIDRGKLLFGGAIGWVELTDVVTAHASPWFHGPFGFVLSQPRALTFKPLRGQQGLFDAPDMRT